MKRIWIIAAAAGIFFPATAMGAGGPGAIVTAIHGQAEIKPLEQGGKLWYRGRLWTSRYGKSETFASGSSWRRAKRGELEGTFLIRTGPRSWVHLRHNNRDVACLESNSLVRIRSGCGFEVEVIRGHASAIDGRLGPWLTRSFSDIHPPRATG